MAHITLQGSLEDPNGSLSVGDQIRFTHNSTTGLTLEGAASVETITPSGNYYIELQYGLVLVEYKPSKDTQFKRLGVATVNATNAATSIPELLNALVPVSSAELIEFQAILADAVTAQAGAETAKTGSETAASISEAFANQLTTSDLIGSVAIYALDTNITTKGDLTSGDGGSGSWVQNGETGQTPSQSPAQLGAGLLNDANGNQWAYVQEGDSLDPFYYGVLSDGANDDTLAWQSVIDAASAMEITSKIIPRPGVSKITSPLVILGGKISIFAVVGTFELQQFTPNTNHINIGDGTEGARRIAPIIEGIIFSADVSATVPWTSGRCLNLNYQYRTEIINCVFFGSRNGANILWDAIYINEGLNIISENCRIEDMANRGYITVGTNTTDRRSVDCWLLNPYIKNCKGFSIEIGAFSEAAYIDNFIITQAGDTPVVINSNSSTENGILHTLRKPNIEASSGVTTGIDVIKGKQVSIEGGWIGKFVNSVRFRGITNLCQITDTMLNGRILVEGDNTIINARITDSNPDGSAGVFYAAGADGGLVSGSISSFTGGGIDVSNNPTRINISSVNFSDITGDYIVGGAYNGGPTVSGISSETQNAGGKTVAASATIDLRLGRSFFQVTGGTTIDNIVIYNPERTVTIQAGSGGIQFSSSGNIRANSPTLAAFKAITLTCDESMWFEG